MTQTVIRKVDGPIMTLAFDRQKRKNALTTEMYTVLREHIEAANADDAIRVILLTGEGPDFSSGNDLHDFLENPPEDMNSPVFRFINAVRLSEKPVVAAVEGLAVGIGTTILLHCDLVYAADNARFKLPFVDLGVTPEAGSSFLLPQNFGYQRAAELLLLCPIFDTKTAQEAGFVTKIVAPGEALAAAQKTAAILAEKAPQALRRAKALMKTDGDTLEERMATEATMFGKGLEGDEFKEAVDAFSNKRKPNFYKS